MSRCYTHLHETERYLIMHAKRDGLGIREISRILERTLSTIARKIRRSREYWGGYLASSAHRHALSRLVKPHVSRKLSVSSVLRSYIFQHLRRN